MLKAEESLSYIEIFVAAKVFLCHHHDKEDR